MGDVGEEAGREASAGRGAPRTTWDEGILIPAERGRELSFASRQAVTTYDGPIRAALQKAGVRPEEAVALQAGGGVGIVPARLCQDFRAVYTFEPDFINFQCLVFNTQHHENLYPFRAALWSEPEGLIMNPGSNAGAGWCVPGGDIPGFALSSLPASRLGDSYGFGLLWLDVEGAEDVVLEKYWQKIFSPKVIVVERKGLERRYVPQSDLLAQLAHDYLVEQKVGNDVILVRRR